MPAKIKIQAPKKLRMLFKKPKRYKIAIGGRGGGKSETFASKFIVDAYAYGEKIGCLREYQNSIEDSVHALIKAKILQYNFPHFEIQKTYIENTLSGGELRFKGFARSSSAIKSFHGFKKFWIEEGQSLSDLSIRDVFPTLREKGSEIWISANPVSALDPFSIKFIVPYKDIIDRDGFYEDDQRLIVKINHSDNPWFPDVLEQERLDDYEKLDRAEYDHKWEGEFLDTVENAIIKREWFDSCIDAHKKLGFDPLGVRVVAHDPADTGGDSKALTDRHGSLIKDVKYLYKDDVNVGCDWALEHAVKNNADLFVWDCDGLGLGLQKQVREALEGKKIDYHMFKGSEGVERPKEIYDAPDLKTFDKDKAKTNDQIFKNKRAQFAWSFRDRVYNTYLATNGKYIDPTKLISISSKIKEFDRFRSESCRIPRVYNSNGLIQIMAKPKMKLIGIESPGGFDSTMMSFDVPPVKPEFKKIKYVC